VKGEELTIGIGRGNATELSIIGCACGSTRVPSRLERRTTEGDSPVGVRGVHMRPTNLAQPQSRVAWECSPKWVVQHI
jgi:hypothetical protein